MLKVRAISASETVGTHTAQCFQQAQEFFYCEALFGKLKEN